MAEIDLARVKRNVGKMVQQSAPESDIDAYISSEGATLDAVRSFKAPDTASNAPVQRQGDAFDVARDVAWQLPQGINDALDATVNAPYNIFRGAAGLAGYNMPEAKPIFGQLNSGVQPEGAAGRVGHAVGEAIGSSIVPAGATYGLAARTAAPLAANAGTAARLGNTLLEGVRAAPRAAAAGDLASATGAGLGAGGAREADWGPTGEVIASTIGGLAPAAGAIGKSMMQLRPSQQIAQNALLEAGQRQNIPISRAVASGDGVVNAAGGISQIPVVGTPIGQGFRRGVEATGERATEIAQNLGSGSRYDAGQAASTAMRDWIKGDSAAINRTMYDEVDHFIQNPNATAPLPRTRQIVQDFADEQARSTSRSADPAVSLVEEALARPNGLTYDGLKNLRTDIGARLSGQITPEPGTSQPALKRLYGALTEDLRNTVQTVGDQNGNALRAFDRANNTARIIARRREELSKVLGLGGNAPPEKVFDSLVQMASDKGGGNLRRLVIARQAMGPAAWQEMQSAAIQRLGRDADGNFSVARYVTAYDKKMSEGGKSALFGGQGNLRQSLDDLVTISRQHDRLAKNFATGSAKTNSMLYMWDKVISGVSGAAAAAIYVNPALAFPAVTSAGGIIAGRQFSKYLGNPTTARAMVRFSRAYVKQLRANSTAARAGLNTAVRALSQTFAKADGSDPAKVEQAVTAAISNQPQ